MNHIRIGFVGGGNMARSLIGGLVANGHPASHVWASDPNEEQRALLAAAFGIHTTADNQAMTRSVDILVLAVKPQVLGTVARELAPAVEECKPLVISVAAGIRMEALSRWLGAGTALVRTMPNTPALVQCGATALCGNANVTPAQREMAEGVMRAVGLTLWVDDEKQMDAVTAVSGSGPAYFFLVMEAMEAAGQSLGLTPEAARLLTLQTAFGSAKMALESSDDAATLRRRVTSPGGTTEQAIKVFEENGLRELFQKALAAACRRSDELARQLGEQG